MFEVDMTDQWLADQDALNSIAREFELVENSVPTDGCIRSTTRENLKSTMSFLVKVLLFHIRTILAGSHFQSLDVVICPRLLHCKHWNITWRALKTLPITPARVLVPLGSLPSPGSNS